MFENLLILIILGCFAYFAWFIWYVHESQITMTFKQFMKWLETYRTELLEEVGDERIGNGVKEDHKYFIQ